MNMLSATEQSHVVAGAANRLGSGDQASGEASPNSEQPLWGDSQNEQTWKVEADSRPSAPDGHSDNDGISKELASLIMCQWMKSSRVSCTKEGGFAGKDGY